MPAGAAVLLVATWGRDLPPVLVAVVAVFLGGAVLAAVHHAEVVAHRVGEPFGSLVLAVAVTVIEVALIVTLMVGGGDKTATLARDTVFAAVMITCNGVVGLALLVAALRRRVAVFNAEGTGGAFATVTTLATLSLVLPSFTTGRSTAEFTAAAAGLRRGRVARAVRALRRHADRPAPRLLPAHHHQRAGRGRRGARRAAERPAGADQPGPAVVALVAVVGDAKTISPAIERGVDAAGFPQAVVGVVIALLVLLPETVAAVRAARRDRVQTSLNLGYGSAMASIGLTIPAIAIASIFLDGPLVLGLGPTEMVLLALTVVVGTLTVVPGRATLLQGGVHLAVLSAFLFLAVSP